MQDALVEFLRRRKDRTIATILTAKEEELDPTADIASSQKVRRVILDQINSFYEAVLDVMSSLDTGDVILNDLYLKQFSDKLDQIHEAVTTNGKSGVRTS